MKNETAKAIEYLCTTEAKQFFRARLDYWLEEWNGRADDWQPLFDRFYGYALETVARDESPVDWTAPASGVITPGAHAETFTAVYSLEGQLYSVPVKLIAGYSNFDSVPAIIRVAAGDGARVEWIQASDAPVTPASALRRY